MGPLRSEGLVTMSNVLIEETPSVGLLIQSKALSSVDTKGQVGPKGMSVTAAMLLVR
eukprot:SAG31_NODE_32803_length_351_cov_1.019841_1_plen_57_part_00